MNQNSLKIKFIGYYQSFVCYDILVIYYTPFLFYSLIEIILRERKTANEVFMKTAIEIVYTHLEFTRTREVY